MKKIKQISKLAFAGLLLLFVSSCDDTSEMLTITEPNAAVLAQLNFTDLELDANNTTNPALTLNWEKADYGQQIAVNYSIEFASDDAFTNPIIASTVTGKSSITLSVNEVNAAAGNAGLNPFNWANIYVRVVSSLGTKNSNTAASNAIQFMVYPYFNYTFDDYYLVGNAAASNWENNNNNTPLYRDPNQSSVFYYTGFFGAGEFKVLEIKGQWQPQWGTNDGSSIEVNDGSGSDPNTFPNSNNAIATAGYYEFKIDFASQEFTFTPFNEAGSSTYAGMSIQGSATAGGATATPINQLSHDQHIWYMNSVRLIPGDINFVSNSGTTFGSDTSFSGTATASGSSIPVIVEDDYDVWFNDLTGRYILIPLNL